LGGLIGAAQVRAGDHLDQRHAAAVEVDQPAPVLVFGLAGVFFDVQLGDADAARVALRHGQVHVAAIADRHVILRDLVALGQVGVKVVFAVEERQRAQFGVHGMRQQGRLFHHGLVENRQHTGQTGADRADVGVGWVEPGVGFAGAEDFGGGVELDMSFQPDDNFILGHADASWSGYENYIVRTGVYLQKL